MPEGEVIIVINRGGGGNSGKRGAGTERAKQQKARRKAREDDQDTDAKGINHNDIPPKPSPAFSTSLSSPSLLALAKGRKIGLASNPTVARNVGLDIPGEPIIGRENGWVNDCICVTTGDDVDELGTDIGMATGMDIRGDPRK